APGESQPFDERRRFPHGQCGHFGDRAVGETDPQGLGTQARAAAGRAWQRGLIALHDEAVPDLVRLGLQPLEERNRSAETLAAFEQETSMGRGQLAPRDVERNGALLGELLEPRREDSLPRTGAWLNRALAERLLGIG